MISLILFVFHCAQASDYNWEKVQKGAASSGLQITGRVVPQDGALHILSARVQGRILALMKREGEKVEAGTPIYQVTSAECTSLVEERKVAETRGLQELAAGVANRERELGLKILNGQCSLVAMQSGVITKRTAEVGSQFNVGDSLATILDIDRLTVELEIPERDASFIKPGQSVKLQFASLPGRDFHSSIETVVPTIDTTSRTTKARVSGQKFPSVALDSMVFGEVNIGRAESLLKIPVSALVFNKNIQYVVRGPENKPEAVAIQVVSESDKFCSVRPIKSGTLKEGDTIATQGAIFLYRKMQGSM